MSLQQVYIGSFGEGLETDKKPYLLPDQAFSLLENAYVWRDRVKKREGIELIGRLRRKFTDEPLTIPVSGVQFNIYSQLVTPIVPEATAEIECGSVEIKLDGITLIDQGDGTLATSPPSASTGIINYLTGDVTLTFAGIIAVATITFGYFPGLPVMGIWQRDIVDINFEPTIWFDTKYAYIFVGIGFQEAPGAATWNATDSDFFWATNYRGVTPDIKLFFVTNFISDANNPMRYFDGTNWTTFAPLVDANHNLYSALILVPYYGRLVALNIKEGTTAGGPAGAVNIQNRCRFSQIGDPTQVDAWRSDLFGKGGFIDAPTNEAIMSAIFYKNTLIVFFERSTWQLRYVGEYGLPFLWERISSDFGSESTNSPILFDQGVLAVGDRAIVSSTGTNVSRIDEKIPDLVYSFRNVQNGVKRVHGIRDFKRELAFWCYSDSDEAKKFPNRVLLYNYRNNTFAIFRDNITTFGLFQPTTGAVTWDSTDIFWDDAEVTWTDPDSQSQFAFTVSGNQQGFVHKYGYVSFPQPSLTITAIDLTVTPIEITSKDHNLETGEIIYIKDLSFVDGSGVPLATDLNNNFYQVQFIDDDTFSLSKWDGDNYAVNFAFTPVTTATYIGCGTITLIYKMKFETKDFNPFSQAGNQLKLSYIDFLTSSTKSSAVSVNLFCNASLAVQGNLLVGNTQSETFLTSPYYSTVLNNPVSDYAWHRFFASSFGMYIKVQVTYDDSLMNLKTTHEQEYSLFGMMLYIRPGGRTPF